MAENANVPSGLLGAFAGALIGAIVVSMATMRTVPVLITGSFAIAGAAFFSREMYIETAVRGANMFGIMPMVALGVIFGALGGAVAGAAVSLMVKGFPRKRS